MSVGWFGGATPITGRNGDWQEGLERLKHLHGWLDSLAVTKLGNQILLRFPSTDHYSINVVQMPPQYSKARGAQGTLSYEQPKQKSHSEHSVTMSRQLTGAAQNEMKKDMNVLHVGIELTKIE